MVTRRRWFVFVLTCKTDEFGCNEVGGAEETLMSASSSVRSCLLCVVVSTFMWL